MWNLDLIFGGATETDVDWHRTLADVLALDHPPPHISAYALTVEPGTPLARATDRHPDEDVLARRYEIAEEVLTSAGYQWEEISNWARSGHECRHNRLYWEQGNYLGIGSAAHGHHDGRRWWNIRTPDRYIDAVTSGRSPEAGHEVLTAEQIEFEGLSLSLRTPRGVPWGSLADLGNLDGLLVRRGDRAVLTVRGRLLADEVTARIASGSVLR
jgi:oxygen-independent coproporphyrinogen-3 oxidase